MSIIINLIKTIQQWDTLLIYHTIHRLSAKTMSWYVFNTNQLNKHTSISPIILVGFLWYTGTLLCPLSIIWFIKTLKENYNTNDTDIEIQQNVDISHWAINGAKLPIKFCIDINCKSLRYRSHGILSLLLCKFQSPCNDCGFVVS